MYYYVNSPLYHWQQFAWLYFGCGWFASGFSLLFGQIVEFQYAISFGKIKLFFGTK